MPSKLLSLKAAAAALVAVLSIGGVAAATGLLPAQRAADQASTTSRGAADGRAQRPAAVDDTRAGEAALGGLCRAYLAGQGGSNGKREDSPAFRALAAAAGGADKIATYCQSIALASTDAGGQGRAGATGPDASGAAKDGLCRAYLAGQGGSNGKREDSPAFRALAAAAGGADKIATYCQGTAPGGSAGSATHPQGQGAPPSTVPAAGPGQGQGQGAPPSTSQGQGQGGPATS